MIGHVDDVGRALIDISIRGDEKGESRRLPAWIETGFTTEFVLPKTIICSLDLSSIATVDAILADGSKVQVETYMCFIEWFGRWRQIEVVTSDGDFPLIGVSLLLGLELVVDYRNLRLSLSPKEKLQA